MIQKILRNTKEKFLVESKAVQLPSASLSPPDRTKYKNGGIFKLLI